MSPGAGASHITVDTSASGDCSVPVWTGKTGINGDFLNSASEDISQIGVKVIVSLTHFSLVSGKEHVFMFVFGELMINLKG
jgi:hypothetical protein